MEEPRLHRRPGTGKSRAARAVARIYTELGLLSSGHVDEVAAASVAGATLRETGILVGETVRRAAGGIVMIPDAHAWYRLPDRGQQVLRRLYQELTEWRDDLAVILAGQAGPLRDLLRASPPLAARFPAVIDFPGYTAGQLAAIFATLAGEAGFTLTPDAASQGRRRARPGRRRPRLRQRPARCPAAGPGHRQPGPPGHSRRPDAGSGHVEHDRRGGHTRAHPSRRPARRRPMARPVPIAAMPWQGRGTSRQRMLLIRKAGRLFRATLPGHVRGVGGSCAACACRSEAGG